MLIHTTRHRLGLPPELSTHNVEWRPGSLTPATNEGVGTWVSDSAKYPMTGISTNPEYIDFPLAAYNGSNLNVNYRGLRAKRMSGVPDVLRAFDFEIDFYTQGKSGQFHMTPLLMLGDDWRCPISVHIYNDLFYVDVDGAAARHTAPFYGGQPHFGRRYKVRVSMDMNGRLIALRDGQLLIDKVITKPTYPFNGYASVGEYGASTNGISDLNNRLYGKLYGVYVDYSTNGVLSAPPVFQLGTKSYSALPTVDDTGSIPIECSGLTLSGGRLHWDAPDAANKCVKIVGDYVNAFSARTGDYALEFDFAFTSISSSDYASEIPIWFNGYTASPNYDNGSEIFWYLNKYRVLGNFRYGSSYIEQTFDRAAPPTDGSLTRILFLREKGVTKLYVNGAEVASSTSAPDLRLDAQWPLYIGTRFGGNQRPQQYTWSLRGTLHRFVFRKR